MPSVIHKQDFGSEQNKVGKKNKAKKGTRVKMLQTNELPNLPSNHI